MEKKNIILEDIENAIINCEFNKKGFVMESRQGGVLQTIKFSVKQFEEFIKFVILSPDNNTIVIGNGNDKITVTCNGTSFSIHQVISWKNFHIKVTRAQLRQLI